MNYPDDFIDQIICDNNLDVLKTFPSESINCRITSPPYWALRDYGVEGQLGLESTFQKYLDRLMAIFDEVKRVLRKDGTCWVVLGDTYSKSTVQNNNGTSNTGLCNGNGVKPASKLRLHTRKKIKVSVNISKKSLLQIPSRFAIMMTDHGWILRNEIIWYKPNCMPSSVKDRFTVDFEKVFFFVKNKKYWFEQQFEPHSRDWTGCGGNIAGKGKHKKNKGFEEVNRSPVIPNPLGRNKRCVWQIPTKPFKEAHFAVFPPTLVEPMIQAGCPENGIILDPFMGSGTVAEVAMKFNRRFIGIELSPKYCEIAKNRISKIQPQLVF